MLGLGQAMIDVIAGAGQLEGVAAERLPTFDNVLDLCRAPTVTAGTGEVQAVAPTEGV